MSWTTIGRYVGIAALDGSETSDPIAAGDVTHAVEVAAGPPEEDWPRSYHYAAGFIFDAIDADSDDNTSTIDPFVGTLDTYKVALLRIELDSDPTGIYMELLGCETGWTYNDFLLRGIAYVNGIADLSTWTTPAIGESVTVYLDTTDDEIKRLYLGAAPVPISSSGTSVPAEYVEDGTFTLTVLGQTTSSITWDNDQFALAAAITAAVETLSNVGSGNFIAYPAADTNGFVFRFIGALSAVNIGPMTAASSLIQKADTVSFVEIQGGIAPANEQQVIDDGGGVGTVDLDGETVVLTGLADGTDTAAIQNACDTLFGSGNTSVTDTAGGSPYTIEFVGSLAEQDIAEIALSNDTTTGGVGVSISTPVEGTPGQPQIIELSFLDGPTVGEIEFSGSQVTTFQVSVDDTAADIEATLDSIGSQIDVTGPDGGPYTWTARAGYWGGANNLDIPTGISVTGEPTPLQKDCGLEIVTVQDGLNDPPTNVLPGRYVMCAA